MEEVSKKYLLLALLVVLAGLGKREQPTESSTPAHELDRIADPQAAELERQRDDTRPKSKAQGTFVAAAVQAVSKFGEPASNRKHLQELVREAAGKGAEVIVLPEAAITGYMSSDLKTTWRLGSRKLTEGLKGISPEYAAESVPGTSTEAFGRLADELDVYLTVPLVELDPETGKYYNTVALMGPDGKLLLHYRKINPWPWAERAWTSHGNYGNVFVDTPLGRMGLLICYDINFEPPDLRKLAVDHLLYPIAWVDSEKSDWFTRKLPNIAQKNNLNIIGANWTVPPGSKPQWHGYGHSLIINRQGHTLAKVDTDAAEQIVYAELPIPHKAVRDRPRNAAK